MSMSVDERYLPLVAVAAVDILGVKMLLSKEDECMSAMRAIEFFVKNSSMCDYYEDFLFDRKAGTFYEFEQYFGDSVYFFADTGLAVGTQVDRLTAKCALIIATGLISGFLVRAGIAVGDLRVKSIELWGNQKREVRIGTSMLRAHMLQESQEWIGGAVESKYPPAYNDMNRFRYHVPVKENSKFCQSELEAVNWVYILADAIKAGETEIIRIVRYGVDWIGSLLNEEVERKLANTIEFVEYVFSKNMVDLTGEK